MQLPNVVLDLLFQLGLDLGLVLDILVEFVYFGFHDWIVSLVRRRAKLRLRSVSHSFLGLRLDFQLIDLIAQFANIRIIWPVANLHIL